MRVLSEQEVEEVVEKTLKLIAQGLPKKDKATDWAPVLGGMFAYSVFEALYKAKAELTP